MKRTTIKLLILALASVLLLALTQSAYAEPTYSVTLIAYDKTNGINEAGGEVAFSDSGKGTTISGDYGENTSRIIGVYPASDYTFTGWAKGSPTGEIVSTASPYTFTVTEAVTFYALFEKVITYPLWVGDTQVTSANKDDILGDGKAKFDPSTITLTLNNPIITGTHSNSVIYAENVHLNLVGSANIIDDTAQTGILVVHHSLTLNGDFNVSGAAMKTGIYASASIEVKGGTISATGSTEGIRAATNNVTISGGEVTAKGVGSNGYGIFSFGNLTISGGTVTATGEKYGIYADNNATISGGTVTATGSEAGTGGGAGIYALNSVSISNGTVTAKGRVRGIHAGIDLSISGGSVAAETWVANESQAIFAEDGNITISGGSVEAKTAATGIYSGGKINIENGTKKVESTAGKQAIVATTELTIGDELMIKEPEGGKLSSDNRAILNADDTTATHALIVPKEITYPVWVAGIQATETNKDDMLGDGKVSFDPASNTLTLNGAAINTDGMHASGAAIVSESIDLTVKGTFTTSSTGYGIRVVKGTGTGCNLTLDGVTATLTAIDTGIAADGNVTINGGTVSVTSTSSYGDAISTQNITISDGTVTATGGKNGIHANGSVIISGGTVTAEAMKGDEGTGIFSENGEITITGGSVKAAGQAGGIYATVGDIEIANGTASVEADGDYVAIHVTHGTIIIGDELMIKEPTGGKLSSDNRAILNADDTTATHALIVPKEKTYVLWVDVTPAGSGKLELAAEAGVWVTLIDLSFPAGEHTLTAKAEDGYVFKEWRDAEADTVLSTANPFTFTLNKDVHYTAVFEKITYAFTKGDGAVWTKGSAAGLDFTVKGSPDDTNTFTNFTGIQIDGAAVAAGNYTAAAGSVELTLTPAYLETLAVGSHTIKAEFKDGVASAAFAVKEQAACTVSFDPNGGTGAMAPVTVNAGEEYTLPASGFTAPAGKEFNGWDKGIPGAKITVEEDTVITAQWKNASDVPPVVTSTPIPAITPTPIPAITPTPIPVVTSTPIPVITPTVAPDVTTPPPMTQPPMTQPPVTPDVTQRPTTPTPMTPPPVTQPPVTRPPVSPAPYVPDDSGYNFRFTFSKLWQGDHEDSIDWVLYNPDGTVAHKKFNKKIVSETEWRYEAWFASGADYYIIENVPAGYRVRYENVGEHASETDRCYNGGTIINYKLPKTGDDANLTLWLGCVLAGLTIVSFAAYAEKRKRAHGK